MPNHNKQPRLYDETDNGEVRDKTLEEFFAAQVARLKVILAAVDARQHAEHVRCGLDAMEVESLGVTGHMGKRCPRLSWYDNRRDDP